jgi:hypothetical protein
MLFDLDGHENLIARIRAKYVDEGLSYGWKSNVEKTYDFGHWNKRILDSSKYHYYDHGKMPFIGSHAEVNQIWLSIQSKIGDRCLLRSYINGYTYGTDAYYHIDDHWIVKKYGPNVLTETVIVYLNNTWNKDWGGETSILSSDNEIEFSVLPKSNRVLVFDSNKFHSARPLSRACSALRSVLVFKTIDKSCLSKEVEYILKHCANLKHTDGTFFEHLYRTSIFLERLEQTKEVCAAGLFHSIYGTEFYKYEGCSDVRRDDIKALIGEYAESLVYEFCKLENRVNVLLDNKNNYNDSFRKDLLFIEYANLLEQNINKRYDFEISRIYSELLKFKKLNGE